MFTDVDYQVDVLSEEYRLLNPVISKMEKRLEEQLDDDEVLIHVLLLDIASSDAQPKWANK